jgi:hypothetical protein
MTYALAEPRMRTRCERADAWMERAQQCRTSASRERLLAVAEFARVTEPDAA